MGFILLMGPRPMSQLDITWFSNVSCDTCECSISCLPLAFDNLGAIMITSHLPVIFIEKETLAWILWWFAVLAPSLYPSSHPRTLPCNFVVSSSDGLPLNIGLNLVTCFGQ